MIPNFPITISSPVVLETVWKDYKDNDIIIDMDVYLPKKGFNLQRESCWTLEQKQKLIFSIFRDDVILPLYVNRKSDKKTYEIIDGKQRYTTLLEFKNNEFPIVVDGEEYFFSDIDDKDKWRITSYTFNACMHYEHPNQPDTILSDDDKINWFLFVNNSGTPHQDDYIKQLKHFVNK